MKRLIRKADMQGMKSLFDQLNADLDSLFQDFDTLKQQEDSLDQKIQNIKQELDSVTQQYSSALNDNLNPNDNVASNIMKRIKILTKKINSTGLNKTAEFVYCDKCGFDNGDFGYPGEDTVWLTLEEMEKENPGHLCPYCNSELGRD